MPDEQSSIATVPGTGTQHADGTQVRVLVVDDEPSLAELLSSVLRYEGWSVQTAGSGTEAIKSGREFRPDAVVLDIMLPDFDGLEVMRRLRAELPDVCVLFLTARDAVEDRVAGLTAGGDDYVTKPFSLEEVLARLRGLLRRANLAKTSTEGALTVADLTMDEDAREVRRGGELIDLTATEFELLRFMMRNPRRVLSKAQILDRVWNYDFGGQAHVVELYISYLRKKIDAGRAPLIHTVRGVGYVLKPGVDDERPMKVHPRARVLPRTLRGRLIVGLLVLLALAGATVGVVTYLAVQNSLTREVDNNLQTATGLAYACRHPNGDDGTTGQPGPADSDAHEATTTGTPSPAGVTPIPGNLSTCQGLAEGTSVAVLGHNQAIATVVGDTSYRLSAADEQTLRGITPSQPTHPGSPPGSQGFQPTTSDLRDAGGTFLLTAVSDPDGDGTVYVTGLPLSQVHDLLHDVAAVEAAVFGAVLLLAGAGGTLWVRFSLRPLRRVAATASQVAELPLESDEVELPAGVSDTDPATETGQVGLAFNRMLGHVQTALRRRAASEARLRRFAADASHELRTPLSAIRGYAELALRHPGDSPEEVTHALGRVLSESTRMSDLVDELLLLARLDAGRPLASEPVDMTRLVIDATSDAQVARRGHRWVLELPDDPVLVSGDEHRLHQVLANVLSNAGKHTPDGATVTVRVGDTLPDAEAAPAAQTVRRGTLPTPPRLVVSVTDNGPGIPPDLLPDLFERFTRADTSRSRTTSASSTGLGLAIVDAVVAAHGGAVLVTSRPGMTSFAIALPRLTEPAQPQPPAAPAQHRRPLPTHKP